MSADRYVEMQRGILGALAAFQCLERTAIICYGLLNVALLCFVAAVVVVLLLYNHDFSD